MRQVFPTEVDVFDRIVGDELSRERHHEVPVAVPGFGVDQVPRFVRLQLPLSSGKGRKCGLLL